MPILTVPLAEVAPATPRSRLLSLHIGTTTFDFLPGQAVMLAAHGGSDWRIYSIASAPERVAATGRLELLVSLDTDAGTVARVGATGDLVDVDGPLGTFVVPRSFSERHLLFVAGGTGIAPLRAMIDHVLTRDQAPQISVLYSARRGDEFAFIDELRAHAEAGRIDLHQTVTREDPASWAGGRGRIGRTHFESVLYDPYATLCFVCGPRPMVEESVAVLRSLGVPDLAIRTEGRS